MSLELLQQFLSEAEITEIKEMALTRGWPLFRRFLGQLERLAQQELENFKDENDAREKRGKLIMIRQLLNTTLTLSTTRVEENDAITTGANSRAGEVGSGEEANDFAY